MESRFIVKVNPDFKKVYKFIEKHYKFNPIGNQKWILSEFYSKKMLQWYFQLPNTLKKMIISLTDPEKNNKIIGFVAGIPIGRIVYANFLCVHQEYRNDEISTELLNKLSKVVHDDYLGQFDNCILGVSDINTQIEIPGPCEFVSKDHCYHHYLNLQKAVDFEYCNDETRLSPIFLKQKRQLQKIQKDDIPSIRELIQNKLGINYNNAQLTHLLFGNENVFTNVKRDNGKVVEFVTFYDSITRFKDIKEVEPLSESDVERDCLHNAIVMFVCSINNGENSIKEIIREAIKIAKLLEFDMLTIKDSHIKVVTNKDDLLDRLKFHKGTSIDYFELKKTESESMSSTYFHFI